MNLQKQIEELKRRIEQIEQRPIYYPVYVPPQPIAPAWLYPQSPGYPYPVITCGSTACKS